MKKSLLVMAILLSTPSWAGDIAAGKEKSVTCVACHGQNGIAQIPMYPNLAGQKEQYLLQQLKAFKEGSRKNMVMSPMVQPLSEEDMKNLAAYYASLSPCDQ
ncbi:Cytochrome c-554(548) [Saliniradius amylolyticus]|uniref:Cytochrome c-554(548) n=1 Tax=Saliniradius amylolyticus TaxID=2183582 RepID=A0A2S2E6T4_9ALTE|nr:cytochrome c [Saliniradius amylolyticus]AWL13361.1 Cytochrome c-554(548) [Saliniradius amylolyticus]